LYALLRELPPAAQDKVLDRLDYGLYFVRRSKGMAYLQRIRDDFITYLRGRYGDGAKTASAWGEDLTKIGENFERVPYPSRGIFQKARGRKREDMSGFAKEAEMKGYDLGEGEEGRIMSDLGAIDSYFVAQPHPLHWCKDHTAYSHP